MNASAGRCVVASFVVLALRFALPLSTLAQGADRARGVAFDAKTGKPLLLDNAASANIVPPPTHPRHGSYVAVRPSAGSVTSPPRLDLDGIGQATQNVLELLVPIPVGSQTFRGCLVRVTSGVGKSLRWGNGLYSREEGRVVTPKHLIGRGNAKTAVGGVDAGLLRTHKDFDVGVLEPRTAIPCGRGWYSFPGEPVVYPALTEVRVECYWPLDSNQVVVFRGTIAGDFLPGHGTFLIQIGNMPGGCSGAPVVLESDGTTCLGIFVGMHSDPLGGPSALGCVVSYYAILQLLH